MAEYVIENYTVGWICTRKEEYEAACRMLDEEFEPTDIKLKISAEDHNTYEYGSINGHYIVIGCLPSGRSGPISAATFAKDMDRSFPNLRFTLLVGIGGGAPTETRDIRLGDVVVSQPDKDLGGVVQIDFWKRLQGDGGEEGSESRLFQRIGHLNSPPAFLLGAMPRILRSHRDTRGPDKLAEHIRPLINAIPEFRRPPQSQDRLFRANYRHRSVQETCECCREDQVIERLPRAESREFMIHYGTIASSKSPMENAIERDRYAKDLGVLCFETEAAGLMNIIPCLVIRGISYYSDSHKNDQWNKYAALTAAAYAKELLITWRPVEVKEMPSQASEPQTTLNDIRKCITEDDSNMDSALRHQGARFLDLEREETPGTLVPTAPEHCNNVIWYTLPKDY
ncbi:hypothetical protein TWF192_001515 [Orbilia oligospora]|uniref:Nucleoside phosphorylase domain-containing protein n=1 Tax=Orbilia oligospora TaxID=2813651 RepID=A0A6G1LTW1_ORBOL|nr:hypothetical protein TWF191_004926 [Orbilia oligospora]KAF3211727.1 hypothetical protein TWF679_006222 [Orbilia oligospora]KAF3234378.1 hypothetical protein TWF192_001515 [Orbilia oligospora]